MPHRVDDIKEIIDYHIACLKERDNPILADTKTITEILKCIVLLEQVKTLEGKRTAFDEMDIDDLGAHIENMDEA